MTGFAELVATAISNSGARRGRAPGGRAGGAAPRRDADHAERERPPTCSPRSPAARAAARRDDAMVFRYQENGAVAIAASWGELAEAFPAVGAIVLDGDSVAARIRRSGALRASTTSRSHRGPWGDPARTLGSTPASPRRSSSTATCGVPRRHALAADPPGRYRGHPAVRRPDRHRHRQHRRPFRTHRVAGTARRRRRRRAAPRRPRPPRRRAAAPRPYRGHDHDGGARRARQRTGARAGWWRGIGTRAARDSRAARARARHPPLGADARPASVRASTRSRRACPSPPCTTSRPTVFPAAVEATAYFVVAEALTNVARHANASRAVVRASTHGDTLRVSRSGTTAWAEPRPGGQRPGQGLGDRVAALSGRLSLVSPAGQGTRLTAIIPL